MQIWLKNSAWKRSLLKNRLTYFRLPLAEPTVF